MSLAASFSVRRGDLTVELDVDVPTGVVVVLLGPNGAGKSTALNALAGLVPVDRGWIVLDGEVLDDPATGRWVPTARRSIGYVFQDYLLFPHLSVLENVAFGLRSRGQPKAEARVTAGRWLERLDLLEQADTRPRALSGGQRQRVALARALATEPRLLLLDEPLAALDAGTRVAVRADLRRHLASFAGTRLVVTHDPLDAMILGDRLVVMEAGRITQQGTPSEVSRRPRTPYVAQLMGVNLLRGTAAAGRVRIARGDGAELVVADRTAGEVLVTVRPQAIGLHRSHPEGSPRNVWSTRIVTIEDARDRARVELAPPLRLVAEVTPAALAELGLEAGAEVWASLKATDITVYPA